MEIFTSHIFHKFIQPTKSWLNLDNPITHEPVLISTQPNYYLGRSFTATLIQDVIQGADSLERLPY